MIWSRAAQFSAQQRNQLSSPLLQHDNDLGLGTGVHQAIFDRVESGRLYGASLFGETRNHRLLVKSGRYDPESIASHQTPPVWAEL